MNHDPFKINEAILDMWRDLKAGDDYIERLEVRNAELVSDNANLKAEVERLRGVVDERDKLLAEIERYKDKVGRLRKASISLYMEFEEFGQVSNSSIYAMYDAAKEGKPSV